MRRFPEVPVLLAALAAPLLPPPYSAVALLALGALWMSRRPPQREVAVVGLSLLVAAGALAGQALLRPRPDAPAETWRREAGGGYARLWRELERDARAAAAALPETFAAAAADPDAQLEAF
ncbi:MAG TPA: hypothetical protein VF121_06345, partial [Thermoanaerobaculia bacterium]|nr:hypothetical protein [Thermoanaerobaculia bacterium]